jgi:dihydroxyacetone synthase
MILTTPQPHLRTVCGVNGNYSGRYIHYGIREHAMASVANGLAAFNSGTFIPVTSSFFMFYLVRVLLDILHAD